MMNYKILGVCIILLGALSIPIDMDITFFIFTSIIGVLLLFSKPEWFE